MPKHARSLSPLLSFATAIGLISASLANPNPSDGLEKVDSENIQSSESVPTPLKAVSLQMGKDPKKWEIGFGAGNRMSILMEMVPEGEKVENWNELSTNMVLFGAPVSEFTARWKAGLESAGAKILEEEVLPDGSIWIVYQSSQENGRWRYLQGPDGVYGVSYQTRPSTEDQDRVEIWREILREASLQQNPHHKP
jgi:hypothetical protein